MKKAFPFFASACLLAGSLCCNAQEQGLAFGVKAGLNVSSFSGRIGNFNGASNTWEAHQRYAPEIGLLARYRLHPVFALQAEVLYSLKGGAYRQKSSAVLTQTNQGFEDAYLYKNYRVNYLELPLTAQLDVSRLLNPNADPQRLHVVLEAGAAPALATGSTLRENDYSIGSGVGLVNANENWTVTAIPHARPFQLMPLAGVLLGVDSGPFISVRYSQALSNVYTISKLDGYWNMNTGMHTVTVSLGTRFNWKKLVQRM
jgi:hypothetical protein